MTHTGSYLNRAALFLRRGCDSSIDEALKDIAFADKMQPDKQNEISKLRVKIRRVRQRLLALAQRAETLSQAPKKK